MSFEMLKTVAVLVAGTSASQVTTNILKKYTYSEEPMNPVARVVSAIGTVVISATVASVVSRFVVGEIQSVTSIFGNRSVDSVSLEDELIDKGWTRMPETIKGESTLYKDGKYIYLTDELSN